MNQPEHDDTLPHQIRLSFDLRQRVNVSCNCQGEFIGDQRGTLTYPSFGLPANTREAKALYNDVTKHDQSRAPFTVEHLLEER